MTDRPETEVPMATPDEAPRWLDSKANVTKVAWTLYIVCAIAVLLDFVIHRHGEAGFDETFGFYGAYGFVGSVLLVIVAKEILRRIVKRPEDYYDD
ncbi:MAG: hypothetical protein ABJ215_01055 [Alphaproteobacteria bacterium]